ncbi:hypothetical protein Pyrfu_1798 [Pyrolobus fumarii 1A]|uniref:Uncharacterized protein n=1 Tax=Pyrolobus fumarii (strain DSM 11204 / 1A) TaxID=694429 RepID=G0ECT2_PYRF1|nr:hypothetical protein [Pyrolobus fumarii]AEM39652.1 hypothetical protein Pyrfu_1798 [Pyrolobus fumarii 1A]
MTSYNERREKLSRVVQAVEKSRIEYSSARGSRPGWGRELARLAARLANTLSEAGIYTFIMRNGVLSEIQVRLNVITVERPMKLHIELELR